MRLHWGVNLLAWLIFSLAVFAPLVWLGIEAIWIDGQLDFSPFQQLLLTPSQRTLLQNSLLLASGATLVALVLGIPFAFLCQKTDMWGRSFFALAYLIPLLIPPYMQAIVWGQLLAKNGAVNTFFITTLGFSEAPLNAYSLLGGIFVLGMAYFPFVTLLTISGLKNIDSRYEEAALLQSSSFRTITRITLPLAMPHILSGAIFVFIFSIIDFGVPDILRIKVFPIEIFIEFSALYNERAAVVLGLPLLVITMVLISLQVWSMRGRSYINFTSGYHDGHHLGRAAQGLAIAFCLIVIGLSVIVPVGALLKIAGPFSTYQNAFTSSQGQIGFSLLVAAGSALLMTILAFVIAHSMLKSSPKIRLVLEYLTQLPFAIAPILLGIGLIKVWNRPMTDWLYGGVLMIVLGYIAHFIPFTIRAVYASLQQMNPRLEEIAWLATTNKFRIIAKITLPLVKNGLITGFFISFILAMGDLGVTLLIMPPGMETIPIKIYNFMHYGAEAMVAALCIILLVLQLLFSLGLLGISKWFK
jgi:iron(III) transport system permease protein